MIKLDIFVVSRTFSTLVVLHCSYADLVINPNLVNLCAICINNKLSVPCDT